MDKETASLELFAYGTIQRGQPLHNWVEDSLWRSAPGTIKGKLYVYGSGHYPVAYIAHNEHDRDMTEVIHGELMSVYLTDTISALIEMETNAGYIPRWADVTVENGETIPALSFHFPDINSWRVGTQIKSGRWTDYLKCRRISSVICDDPEMFDGIVRYLHTQENMTRPEAADFLEIMLFDPEETETIIRYAKEANDLGFINK